MTGAEAAADALIRGAAGRRLRSRESGVAVGVLAAGGAVTRYTSGADPLSDDTAFEWASITKTLTGTLLAYAEVVGELSAQDRLGAWLECSGPAGDVTLRELATHRSGLPRLPANMDKAAVDPSNPYAGFTASDLRAGLPETPVGPKQYLYSNLGFMALGEALAVAAGRPYGDLVRERIFLPLGMTGTAAPAPLERRVPGYARSGAVPWWAQPLPGAGGVGGPLPDLMRFLTACVEPPEGRLGEAITLATTRHEEPPNAMGYGWQILNQGLWHNGGSGGFRSWVGLHRPTGSAVAVLTNTSRAKLLDLRGVRALQKLVDAAR